MLGFIKYLRMKLVFVIIMIIISYYYCERRQVNFKENVAFTTGFIINLSYRNSKSPAKTLVQYVVNNKVYKTTFTHSVYCVDFNKNQKFLRQMPIIIAYDSTKLNYAEALVRKEQFQEFNYQLPDSLEVDYENYFFSCQ